MIATPLPPKQTFLDDPLRVLRAVRFGTRFGCTLDKALKQAAACEEVRAAIRDKISRERIGTEVHLMVSGNDPVQAVNYLCDLKLFWIVFSLPPNAEPPVSEMHESGGTISQASSYFIHFTRVCMAYNDAASKLMHSIRGIKLKLPVSHFIIFDSLRRGAEDAEKAVKMHRASKKFASLLPFITSEKDMENAELELREVLIDVPTTSKL